MSEVPNREDVHLAPCPKCGADWRRTEIIGEAHHGGGYRLDCHECGHKWDDRNASHGARDAARATEARTLRYLQDRTSEAYHHAPCGSWWQRWIPGVCKHPEVRCTHGDEINGRGGRRRVCMVCGSSLNGPLPALCFFTGKPHLSHSGRDVESTPEREAQPPPP